MPGGGDPVAASHPAAATRSPTSRVIPAPTPALTAQPSAVDHPTRRSAGLNGGPVPSSPVGQRASSSLRVAIAAAIPLRVDTSFHAARWRRLSVVDMAAPYPPLPAGIPERSVRSEAFQPRSVVLRFCWAAWWVKGRTVRARRDEGWALGTAPHERGAPIAIIDFLANAEAVVERLAGHTCVPDWVLVRRLRDEWIVLAGSGDHGFVPGDPLVRPPGVAEHLAACADAWTADVVVDLTQDHVEPGSGRGSGVEPLAGVAAFPLWGSDGLFGAVCALPRDEAEEQGLRRTEPMVRLTVELLTSVLGLDLDRSRLQRRLDDAESAALSDALTTLGNRRAFDRALEREEARCARFGQRAGVMVLDLDGLKDVNDRDGHDAGDELLRRAARTIKSSLRTSDQAFRTGGDEFALLLPEVTEDGLVALCERLAEALEAAGVSASIGSALRATATGDLRDVAREADARMYERKRARTGGCR